MNHHKFSVLVSAALLMLLLSACATLREPAPNADLSLSTKAYNTPNQGNPIVPGYWADPSLHKFGDTFYIYFTSEGGERGAYTWKSRDKKNWTLVEMPFTNATVTEFWAPSALEANGQYYLYYSKALNGMFVATAPTPEGPWTERTELFGPSGIDIDPQPFVDDDGTVYLYWGTAGVAKVARLTDDLLNFAETPQTLSVTDYYEGPQMIKRGGRYLFTYSEGWFANDTYRVGYSVASTPYGPFTQGANSPILETSGNIRGPGHHSLFQDSGQDYIIYHRHRVPFNPFWEILRQLAVDPITIRNNGVIDDITPTHSGVSGWGWRFDGNLARGAAVTASSSYSGDYMPASAVDDNNATRWAASGYAPQWLQLDLGSVQSIRRVMLAFEFLTEWTRYRIESSIDGVTWSTYIDRTGSLSQTGIIEHQKTASARYLRVTVTGFEDGSRLPSITEFKVFK